MRQLKKKLLRDGLFNEIRERRYFKSNTEKRLKAEAAAAARHRRRQAKEDW
jgi:ribosomal protein S21